MARRKVEQHFDTDTADNDVCLNRKLGGSSGEANMLADPNMTDDELVKESLRLILRDPMAPAASKASAARTLAEIAGLLGKHAKAPETEAKPLAAMSREELLSELQSAEGAA